MRKTLGKKTEKDVLIDCRRRCAICFGLSRDVAIKRGQIAHLDQDNSNSEPNNLVYLCFDHHDQYDSKTRQSKNFTEAEVRHYRDELTTSINDAWKDANPFNITPLIDLTQISGHYVWESSNATAELDIRALGNNQIEISGIALWGTKNIGGPNIGQLDFTAVLKNNEIQYVDPSTSYKIKIQFTPKGLSVIENNIIGQFGMNVSFAGDFQRADQVDSREGRTVNDVEPSVRNGNIFLGEHDINFFLTKCQNYRSYSYRTTT